MSSTEWKIAVGADSTRAVYEPATSGEDHAVFVCAHGAGGSISDRSTLAAANALRLSGQYGRARSLVLRDGIRAEPLERRGLATDADRATHALECAS